jgi:hypothetical protein
MKKVIIAFFFVTVSILTYAQVPNYVPTNGLVGWWPFNGNANDLSGNGNNGTVNGATLTTDRFGNSAAAYSFDGVNDFISIPDNNSLDFTTTYTISVWVQIPDYSTPQFPNGSGATDAVRTILGKPRASTWTTGYSINSVREGTSNNFCHGNNDGSSQLFVLSNSPLLLNVWTNIIAVKTPTSLSLYRNGVLEQTVNGAMTLTNSSEPLYIGKEFTNTAPIDWYRWYKGKADDIGIWNRALTQQEVTNLYNSSVPSSTCLPTYVPTNGLVGYWPFCGNANDESGNSNNGTVNGATLTTDRFGNTNQSYNFNGINQYITIPPAANQNTSSSYSISFWISANDTTAKAQGNEVISDRNSTSFPFRYRMNFNISSPCCANDTTILGTCGTSSCNDILSSLPTPNTWYNFVLTYDGASQTLKGYKNGVLLGSKSNVPFQTGNRQINIGRSISPDFPSGIAYYNGKVDDIGLWNRALTQQEINNLYNGACNAQIQQNDTAICSGQSITLSASNANNGVQSCSLTSLPSNLQSGLVGYYPFCGNANDVSLNGYNGTVNGATLTSDRFGNSSAAYNFNGINNYILLPLNAGGLAGVSQFTISYWVNTSSSNAQTIYNFWGAPPQNQPSGFIASLLNYKPLSTFVGGLYVGNQSTITTNSWNNVLIIYDGTQSIQTNRTRVYINGILTSLDFNCTNCSSNIPTSIPSNTATNTSFGARLSNSSYIDFLNGKLDDIGFWNRVLTAQEVQQLYNLTNTQYLWSNGATTPTITVSPTQTTTYTLTVTENGVSCTDNVTVTVNPLPTPSVSGTNTICSGASTTLTASGGNSYVWSTGATSASITVSPTQTTAYTVTATGNNGCTASATRTVTVNPLPTPSITGTNSICIGNSTTLTASGGTSYVWSTGATTASITVSPTQTTTYTVTATNGNGCTGNTTRTVTVNPLPTPSISGVNTICAGNNTTLSASGGASYVWSTGATTSSITVSPTQTTTYTVTATNINGCSASVSQAVTVNLAPTPSISGTNSICSGASTTLTASGGNSYVWSTGATTSSITVSPTQTTTYTVTATGSNGCAAAATRTVTVNPAPTPSITGTNSVCIGNSTTLTASGGTSYVWSTGATTASITVSPTQTTTYTVTATNGNGCTGNTTRTVTVNPLPTPSISGVNTICAGNSTTLSASGGTSYAWSNGSTSSSITVSPGQTTTYTVTATNSNGCSASVSQAVTVNPAPIPNISGTNSICSGASTTLTASGGNSYVWSTGATSASITVSPTQTTTYAVTATGSNGCTASTNQTVTVSPAPNPVIAGTNTICSGNSTTLTASGGTSYVWSTGATSASITVSPTQTTTYTVTVTNGNGCNASASQTVTVSPSPSPSITGVNSICLGANTTLTASGGNSYVWSNGSTSSSITVAPGQTATYTVTAFNGNGCSATASQTVTVSNPPSINIAGITSICQGSTTTLTATGGVSYTWNTGATTNAITVSPNQTTNYTVTVDNGSGCSSASSVTVTVVPGPVLSISGTNTLCSGNSTTLTVSGGNNYNWSNGATTASITVAPTQTTTYTVTSNNGNGCTAIANIIVTVNPTPVPTITPSTTVCSGSSVLLTATGGDSYLWNTGSTNSSITVSPSQTTNYNVAVSNLQGCTTNASTSINVVPALTPLDSIYGPTTVDTLQPYAYFVLLDFNATAYQWLTTCGTITTGQGTNSVNIVWDDTASCELTVIVSNAGCADTLSTIVNQNTTAITEQSVRNGFILYPNPANENVTISLNKPANNVAIEVYDMYGKLIMAEVNKSGKQFDLNTSTLAPGAYMVKLMIENKVSNRAFIKL